LLAIYFQIREQTAPLLNHNQNKGYAEYFFPTTEGPWDPTISKLLWCLDINAANLFFPFIQSTPKESEDSTELIARSTFTTRYQLITLGCALLAAAPRATSARLQPAFISSGLPFVKSLRQCLPLRGLHRALPQTRAHTMAASTGPGYAQKRYIPLQVESSITYEDIATFPRPGSVPCPSHDAFKLEPNSLLS